MKFIIDRAECYEGPPLVGAVKESARAINKRWNTSLGEVEEWVRDGHNHRMEGKYSVKDVDRERWWIDVDTLEGLLDLMDASGHPIVVERDTNFTDAPMKITIYDGYLE